MQGEKVTRDDDNFFIDLFQGILCLFLLEMGMTASRKLKDLKIGRARASSSTALLAPNLFATIGILRGTRLRLHHWHTISSPGPTCCSRCSAGGSYIAVPAVQRLAIPEASPTLPLAASLGLTFSWNVTIGIPIYIEIANAVMDRFPVA